MRQPRMIAIALACGPSFLVQRLGTTALDVTVQAQILDLLERSNVSAYGDGVRDDDLGVVAGGTRTTAVMYASG
jgi:ABC-type dipeptide/oligopeptide/nickel transport system ATPase component